MASHLEMALYNYFVTLCGCRIRKRNARQSHGMASIFILLFLISLCHGDGVFFGNVRQLQQSPVQGNSSLAGNLINDTLNFTPKEATMSTLQKSNNTTTEFDSLSNITQVFMNDSSLDAIISDVTTSRDQNGTMDLVDVKNVNNGDFTKLGIQVTSGKFNVNKSRNNDTKNNNISTKESNNKIDNHILSQINQNLTDLDEEELNDNSTIVTPEEKEEMDKLTHDIKEMLEDNWKKYLKGRQPYGEKIKDDVTFGSSYYTQGILTLPYDGITEPFESWYAGKKHMSRIDYYYGMDKTFQRGDLRDHGVMVKVIPAHYGKNGDLDKNTISCWYRPGFRWNPVKAQRLVPSNLKDFKFEKEEIRSGMPTLKYIRTRTIYNKTNTYTLYITKEKPYRPLRYVMHGIDTLLHSYYDHYVIDYLAFHPWKFNFEVMKIPKGNYCEKNLSKQKSKLYFNPMAEFMHENFDDVDVEELYQHFKEKHNKPLMNDTEHERKKHIFRHNMRFIRAQNRAGLNYSLDSNELADLSDDEFEEYKGLLIDPSGGDEQLKKQIIPEVRFSIPHKPPPTDLDWRVYGAVVPPKAQGHCGSCWTFSAMGAIEGAYAIQTGKLEDFSEQRLLDCSWGFGNYGCRGGFSWRALEWAKKFGVTTAKSYGRYLSQEGYCHCAEKDNCTTEYFSRVMTVPKLDEEALRLGIAWYGPASIAVNVNRKAFKFYSSGVLDDPKCRPQTNHGVVVVGYGVENDKPYWLIKNSWGKLWGDKGFIKIARKNNMCGILTNEPIFVQFNTTGSYHGEEFPFLRMNKTIVKDQINENDIMISPLDYKRSHIDFWTPPDFSKNEG